MDVREVAPNLRIYSAQFGAHIEIDAARDSTSPDIATNYLTGEMLGIRLLGEKSAHDAGASTLRPSLKNHRSSVFN